MMFRCVDCPTAFCAECNGETPFDAVESNPEWEELGFFLPKSFEYVRCGDCCVKKAAAEEKAKAEAEEAKAKEEAEEKAKEEAEKAKAKKKTSAKTPTAKTPTKGGKTPTSAGNKKAPASSAKKRKR